MRDRKRGVGGRESANRRNFPQGDFSRQEEEFIRSRGSVWCGALGSTQHLRTLTVLPATCYLAGSMLVKSSKQLFLKIVLPFGAQENLSAFL